VTTLARLVEVLGRSVLEVRGARGGLEIEIREPVAFDLADPPPIASGDLVLGMGLGPDAAAELLPVLAGRGAAALVVKASVADAVEDAAARAGVALLAVPRGVLWTQAVSLIQSVTGHTGGRDRAGGVPPGDLFATADAVATLIGGPVTVEDRQSRLLAYSGSQGEADSVWSETVVARRVPERIVERLRALDVPRRLHGDSGPVLVEALEPGMVARLGVAVRAGDEILGSMWAAVVEPPPAERQRAFAEAAEVVALQILRQRAQADVERLAQADLVVAVIRGDAGAGDAINRLGLAARAYRVLAVGAGGSDAAAGERTLQHLWDLLTAHLAAFRVRGAAAPIGGVLYAVLATAADPEASRVRGLHVAGEFVERAGATAGLGGYARTVPEIPRSRQEADAALRVVRSQTGDGRGAAAIDEVRMPALVLRFGDLLAEDRDLYERRIAALVESDRTRGTVHVETLRAWLEAFGDVAAAAAALHVHPNTVRHRLGQIRRLARLDLDDPQERLGLALLLATGHR